MYLVRKPGTNGFGRTAEFATPDAAYEHARKESRSYLLIVRSGKGLDSSVKAFALNGDLFHPRECVDCEGGTVKTRYSHTQCCMCDGEGATIGEAVP